MAPNPWISTQFYEAADTVIGSDGNLYRALQSSVGQNPLNNATYWWQETSIGGYGSSPPNFIENDSATPSTAPTNGGYLYAFNGALYWYGPSGTITKIANS